MRDAVVFDVDGTLCDVRSIRYLVKGPGRNSESRPTHVRRLPIITSGFEARRGLAPDARHVAVEHVLGERARHLDRTERQKRQMEVLKKYREHLEQRYTVTDNADEDGVFGALLVWDKEAAK